MKRPNEPALSIAWVIAFSSVLLLPASGLSHHATAAEYDISKTVSLKGTITRVDWANPHIHVYMQMKPDGGAPQEWDVEFPSPGAAIVAGLSKQTLANGVELTVEGYLAKPGFHPSLRKTSSPDQRVTMPQHFACATAITLSSGSRLTFVVGI